MSSLAISILLALLCTLLFRDITQRFLVTDNTLSTTAGDTSFPYQTAIICSLILCSHILPFYRTIFQRRVKWNTYSVLFEYSWNQSIAMIVASLFTLLVIGILFLAVGLFGILGIDLSDIVLRKDVMFIVSGGAFGLGIGITRTKDNIVHGMRQLLLSLLRAVLPILLFITVAFVIVGLTTGLNNIETGWSVTFLLLLSIGLCVLLCSAAVGDTRDAVSSLLSTLCRAQSLVILLMALLASWAMWQRIDQYGLTHSRIIASVAICISVLYGLGYALASLSKSLVSIVQQCNVLVAFVSITVAIIIQTPFFDTVRIATSSQLAAFQNDSLPATGLDLAYLHFAAGNPGKDVIEIIKQDPRSQESPLREKFSLLEDSDYYYSYRNLEAETSRLDTLKTKLDNASSSLRLFSPSSSNISENHQLRDMLLAYSFEQLAVFNSLCLEALKPCYILETQATDKSQVFLLVIRASDEELFIDWWSEKLSLLSSLVYTRAEFIDEEQRIVGTKLELDELIASLDEGSIPFVEHTVQAIPIGKHRILLP